MRRPGTRARYAYAINDSIHDPPEPSPSALGSGETRALWDSVNEQALDYYGETDFAERTAWRVVRLHYTNDGHTMRLRRNPLTQPPLVMPHPGNTTIIGKALEYVWVTPSGDMQIRNFPDDNPPDIMWSPSLKALMIFPHQHLDEVCVPLQNPRRTSREAMRNFVDAPSRTDPAVVMFKRWSEREAKCAKPFEVPEVTVKSMGPADTVVYRSDKWHDENTRRALEGSQDYIHTFGPDTPWIWQDNDKDPTAIMIRGGKLDAHERGIIH